MDVVDKIVNAPRNSRDLPDSPVAMTSVTIQDDGRTRPRFDGCSVAQTAIVRGTNR